MYLILGFLIFYLTKMPPKRRNIGLRTNDTKRKRLQRTNETEDEHANRIEAARLGASNSRANETQEQLEIRIASARMRTTQTRSTLSRYGQNVERQIFRSEQQSTRANRIENFNRIAFQYNPEMQYDSHPTVVIESMDKVCAHCKALKFKHETPGMCCVNGKIKLPPLNAPPEPLHTLLSGTTPQSNHFLTNIRKYNACFQMTSFGASNIITDNFMPTFKVQRQIYHKAGSLLPVADADHQFLQIYFIGDTDEQVNHRSRTITGTKPEIIRLLQDLLHEHNELIKLFKTAIDQMPSDDYKIVIRADKTPVGQHSRRFNAPTISEVAIVIVGDQFESRDIVLHRRNNQLKRVSETHRSYDALQYPILFWQGEDGYHFNIKMINPANGKHGILKIVYTSKCTTTKTF